MNYPDSFVKALQIVLANEGYYSNDPADRGGETYCGISRRNWPNAEIWKYVDKEKPLRWNQKLSDPAAEQAVMDFYYNNFWSKQAFDKIKSQIIVNFVFDFYVNSGSFAILSLQSLLKVTQDGYMGKVTAEMLNGKIDQYGEWHVMANLVQKRTEFVYNIVLNHPEQRKFLNNWLYRIRSFITI